MLGVLAYKFMLVVCFLTCVVFAYLLFRKDDATPVVREFTLTRFFVLKEPHSGTVFVAMACACFIAMVTARSSWKTYSDGSTEADLVPSPTNLLPSDAVPSVVEEAAPAPESPEPDAAPPSEIMEVHKEPAAVAQTARSRTQRPRVVVEEADADVVEEAVMMEAPQPVIMEAPADPPTETPIEQLPAAP